MTQIRTRVSSNTRMDAAGLAKKPPHLGPRRERAAHKRPHASSMELDENRTHRRHVDTEKHFLKRNKTLWLRGSAVRSEAFSAARWLLIETDHVPRRIAESG